MEYCEFTVMQEFTDDDDGGGGGGGGDADADNY